MRAPANPEHGFPAQALFRAMAKECGLPNAGTCEVADPASGKSSAVNLTVPLADGSEI